MSEVITAAVAAVLALLRALSDHESADREQVIAEIRSALADMESTLACQLDAEKKILGG